MTIENLENQVNIVAANDNDMTSAFFSSFAQQVYSSKVQEELKHENYPEHVKNVVLNARIHFDSEGSQRACQSGVENLAPLMLQKANVLSEDDCKDVDYLIKCRLVPEFSVKAIKKITT